MVNTAIQRKNNMNLDGYILESIESFKDTSKGFTEYGYHLIIKKRGTMNTIEKRGSAYYTSLYYCPFHKLDHYGENCPLCKEAIDQDIRVVRFWTGCRKIYIALLACAILLYVYFKII
jgi:hypothetical protein